ncbi:hypothetical protein ERO13_A11G322000v2 [Gossypium hirsutum]|uniref:Histidine kinase/HSP90-like ATPase domain-containing protein n=3 Tax=Gossypium TaxID=3633 RepID=A0A5J5U0B6_GOSBA|nr:DNA topoisomerase 4 subunit B-like isoform X2 [Gossypium hirsutum]KAB2060078.1 hypothetical protein ES319_A11G353300v1 [Gossypium barbadense]TYI04054.1 hypothetical protein ES332_A11G388100v1 [Gossypium tomentosum]KAB2060080.1 hypothetical protein ES319_A11G353300v1 [Gossypium barbadense]KAB2060082.1 hypothetical protein ES319_A11G353300v1 [Gossypium barbadense]KAG4177664.1 hypothetical protein ERO13_A11G322000v2 [Gossypium hirsutum]
MHRDEALLVYEILDNAVHEAQAGFATQIDVLHSDGSVSITDNGRGPIGAISEGKTDVMKKIRFPQMQQKSASNTVQRQAKRQHYLVP